MMIREARANDAEAMSAVLIASITELCAADHHDDPAAVAAWTENKTADGIRRWFGNGENRLFVAEEGGRILAVGGYTIGGMISLNYVAPAARFRGASKAMLKHMETAMRAEGISEARLESTTTANRFYRAAGWVDRGTQSTVFGATACRAMAKSLSKGA